MRVLVTEPNIWEQIGTRPDLAAAGCELVFVPLADRPRLLDELKTVDAYVGIYFTAEMAEAANRNLKLLQVTAAGTNQVEDAGLPDGVPICNSFGHGRSIAEYVIATTIAARRGLLWRDRKLRFGMWDSRLTNPESPRFQELQGSTMGIIGYGHVGTEIATVARAMGLGTLAIRNSANDPAPAKAPLAAEPTHVSGPASLDAVCALSDTLVLAAPLTDETRNMISRRQLELLGPNGCLVNVGRGALVHEQDLYDALATGTLGSAVLDVWNQPASAERKRPSELPFETLDNVIMTPHFSATSDDTYRKRSDEVAQNLLRLVNGETLSNLVRTTCTRAAAAK